VISYLGETAVYIVLAILILAFLFFVGNTIRCYLNKPKYVDEDDEHEMEDSMSGKI
jgi:Na+-transporting methylmalonyl-CoA/oxaloacetate decarboxylase gamma subunit